jgi:serine/threonine protein kinase
VTNDPLPEIETIWHHQKIDVLSLTQTKRHRSNVHEVYYSGTPAISKIAAFDWNIPSLERETWAYSFLDQHQRPEFGEPRISPQVLGHLTECGRVIGILLERLDGESASVDDLPGCESALRRLHAIGLVHGDVNRYNFVVNRQNRQVSMVDFEHAAALNEEAAEIELHSLSSELKEETGRGGLAMTVKVV